MTGAGAPTAAELAAVAAAVAAVLEEEVASNAADPLHPAYRSAWRRAGIRDALDAGTVR